MSKLNSSIEPRSSEWELPAWYLLAYNILVILVFLLIALGGSVRIMKAGLACPDWPLCFGDVIPDYHPQVYFEFIHRVVAGLVALATVAMQVILFRSRAPRALKWLAAGSLVLLATQIVFGGLTVLLLLKSGVVATHLILGTGFFSTLLWIYLSLKSGFSRELVGPAGPARLKIWALFMVSIVYGQILLGGLVAANFAALVCTDFPKCQGEWFPTFSGIIGLHLIHRLGAYTVFVMTLINGYLMHRHSTSDTLKTLSRVLLLCVCGQVALGIANVLFFTPPLIAVAHLALGVGVLSIVFRQLHVAQACARDNLTSENRAAVRDGPLQKLEALSHLR